MFYDYSFMSNHCILCQVICVFKLFLLYDKQNIMSYVICVFKLFLLYDKQLFLIERNSECFTSDESR